MPLDEWLVANRVSNAAFGRICGLSRQTIFDIRRRGFSSHSNAEKILKATDGQVAMQRQPFGFPADLKRLRRLVTARKYGVTLGDIAGRFGFKNQTSAKYMVWYARQKLKREMQLSGKG